MTYASILIIVITSLGFLNFQSSRFGKLKLKTLSPGVLTLNIIAYGTLHFMIGVITTLILATFLGFLIDWNWLFPVQLNHWLFSFFYLGLDYQVAPAIWLILLLSIFSAKYEHQITKKGKKLEGLSEIEQVSELVDSERDRFLIDALQLENSTILNGNVPMVRVVMKSRKVYIGSVIRCDIQYGNTENIVLQPNHSGFISKERLELELTEHYESFFQQRLKAKKLVFESGLPSSEEAVDKIEGFYNQFAIIIPISEVVALSLFDMDEYKGLLEQKVKSLRGSH